MKFFSLCESVYFLKVENKEFVKEFFVQKVSKLMQARFTSRSKVIKIRCCPVNQLKLFDLQ